MVRRNKGDEGEVSIINKIFMHRNDKQWNYNYFGQYSCTVLISPSEFLKWENKLHWSPIENEKQIKKAGGSFKADLILIFLDTSLIKRVSIKCFDGGAPTIMNHTHRAANCWTECLNPPDTLVFLMNELRTLGTHGEDIKLSDLQLNASELKNLKEIVLYFVSEGSGNKKSKVSSDSILYAKNNEIIQFYPSVSDYVDSLITSQKLVLSIRNKGYTSKKALKDSTWLYQAPFKKPKGALNIRLTQT